MNLIVDIGNTKIKAFLYQNQKQAHTFSSDKGYEEFAAELFAKCKPIRKAIVSSVREYPEQFIQLLKAKIEQVLFFDARLPIPINNLYESKNTLGYDRIAACIGASQKYPNSDILVIDAGTAITFDFVNSKHQYIGGCISPGLNMRFKALNQFTKKLPLLSYDDDFSLIGKNTNQAIRGGVQNGIIFEVASYITQMKKKYPELKVILTGGNSLFIGKNLEYKIEIDTNILAFGLNTILEFNSLESTIN